jgi:cyclophilin family peptidyl-prolyl cis-trans isomerase
MQTEDPTGVPAPSGPWPYEAGIDHPSSGWLQPQATTSWADGFGALFAWAVDTGAPADSLRSMAAPTFDLPDFINPVPAGLTGADLAAPTTDRQSLAVADAAPSPAEAPLLARSSPESALALNSAALVAPQVLASGTWLFNPQVTLKTSLGTIVVELYPNAAPVTVANHLAYVNAGFHDGLLFHRVMPGFVVQGGGFSPGLVQKAPSYAPIQLESNNGLSNDRGTLAMARTSVPESATSQFFINLVDNPGLNYASPSSPGYAVFGKVLGGLSVVDAIAAVATRTVGNFQNVPVTDVVVVEADQTRQGTVHSTTGRIDIGILAGDAVWSGQPAPSWEYSLDGGAHWALGVGRSFVAPQGAYESGAIQLRYKDALNNVGGSNGPGGNVVVDSRAVVAGDAGANRLTGTSAADNLYGLGGNDTLDGGSGSDSMVGGSGNDSYIVQSAGDQTVEATRGGTDSVSASVSHTLASNVEKLVLTGSAAINGIGNALANAITGNAAANRLTGGSGNDTLNGGAGNDSLDGGSGLDTFRFSSTLGSSNVDTLSGFVAADDLLQLENSVFLKLTATGALNANLFRGSSTGAAVDSNDYINYETDTGKLFYDADGNGPGAAVLFATLAGAPTLTADDLFVT